MLVVNRRMKPNQALKVVRAAARKSGYRVEAAPERNRGSHESYRVLDRDGKEVGAFGVTRHPRKMSWTVMHSIEDSLVDLFGDRWMEK